MGPRGFRAGKTKPDKKLGVTNTVVSNAQECLGLNGKKMKTKTNPKTHAFKFESNVNK